MSKVYVIRTETVDETVAFFTALGLAFEPEQHGERGQPHFSCQVGDCVFEIYPPNRQGKVGAGFYVDAQLS